MAEKREVEGFFLLTVLASVIAGALVAIGLWLADIAKSLEKLVALSGK